MRVIIVGAGNVGMGIGRRLSADGHDVVMLDRDESRVEEIRDSIDAEVRVGNGASIINLIEAGVRNADLLLAVGDNDESNVIASLVASKLGVKRTIARVRNVEFYVHPDVISSKEDLGVDLMINPELVAADEIARLLQHTGASDIADLAGGKLQLVGVILENEDMDIYGRSLAEISTPEMRSRFRLVAIQRGESKVIIPTGADELRLGDHLYFVSRAEHTGEILDFCGKADEEATHVVIFGANPIGIAVAQQLSRYRKEVKIFDRVESRVFEAALALPGALANVGDGTDIELLQSEQFGPGSAVVAVTDDEESNILIGLMAKKAGARMVIVLVRRPQYVNLVTSMGIDAAVNPHLATVSEVLRFLRGSNILALTALEGGEAELLHLKAVRGQKAVGVPLSEVSFPRGAILGAIEKKGRPVIPTGDTIIEDGDVVIAFSLAESAAALQELFAQGESTATGVTGS